MRAPDPRFSSHGFLLPRVTKSWITGDPSVFRSGVAIEREGYRHEEDDPLGLLASLLLVAPAVAVVQAQQPGPSKERAPPAAKITEEQAKKIALERIPGKVTDVAIEKKGGKNVYVIEIQSPEQGEKDVFVDIETGKIIGTD